MTYLQFSINCITDKKNIPETIIAYLTTIGFDGFQETDSRLKAFIIKEKFNWDDFRETIDKLKSINIEIDYNVSEEEDQNWNKEWEKNFDPVVIGDRVLIRAPFHPDDEDLPCTIVIEPKMSFGTGHHQTTRLMIKEMLKMELAGKRVLDMGCGTGILSMFASKNGAAYVLAIDIDNWAYENALENIAENDLHNIEVKLGDKSAIAGDDFDMILANINRNTLVSDISEYRKHLRKGGSMILSGFLTEDVQFVLDAAYASNLNHLSTTEESGWLVLTFRND